MPPFRTSFAVEEWGSRVLVPGPLSTAMTWILGVLCVEFGVMDLWEDFQGQRAESRASLSLDFHIGAYFLGPMYQEPSDRAVTSVSFP